MPKKVMRVLRLPLAQKGLLLETLVLLALAGLAVLLLPFRWIARALGKQETQTPEHEDSAQAQQLLRLAFMLRKASKNVPWTSKCLDQTMAAKFMLARSGIAGTINFGVRNDESSQLAAHAWLRSGTYYVTGGEIRNRFTIINTFA
jgi:Transglutaminase-like superfamily